MGKIKNTRPALDRLEIDIRELIDGKGDSPGLKPGFDSRRELLHWEQRLVVRTLGEVRQFILQGIANQLASPKDRPLVQALVSDSKMDETTSKEMRKRVRKKVVRPAFERAYRRLRVSAIEYIGDDDADGIDPEDQPWIIMRPALAKLDRRQHRVLYDLLDGGLEDRDKIMEWGIDLEHATHGESIVLPTGAGMPLSDFLDEVEERDPWAEMMILPGYQRVREAFAARYLIPSFNAGVRWLTAHAGEDRKDDPIGPNEVKY